MVEAELRAAYKQFNLARKLRPDPAHDRLSGPLAELMKMLESPGQAEARSLTPEPVHAISTQPLPTGQIPDEGRKEFTATG